MILASLYEMLYDNIKKRELDLTSSHVLAKPDAASPPAYHNETYLTHHHNFDKMGATDSQRAAVTRYTNTSYLINHHLLKSHGLPNDYKDVGPSTEENIKQVHSNLTDLFKKAPSLEEPLSVFSGIDRERGLRIGGIYHTPAYTSTSIRPSVAVKFANTTKKYSKESGKEKELTKFGRRHVLHFKLPTGYSKGLYVGDNATPYNRKEKEFLLAPDQKWKITKHSVSKNQNKLLFKGTPQHNYYTHVWELEPYTEEK